MLVALTSNMAVKSCALAMQGSDSRSRYPSGISICIPAFNEDQTIDEAVKSASLTLQQTGLPGEILVIDDASVDGTWDILQRLEQSIPKLRIRRHEINQGIARTFDELYHWAGMNLVFLNSADGQWNMNILIDMVPLTKQYDLVIARRKSKHYGPKRLLVSWLFNVLPILLFGTETYDAGSVKLVKREIYDIPIRSAGVFAEAERIIKASRRGYRVGVADVEHFPRKSGKASGAKFSLVIEALIDLCRCWIEIVLLRR